MSAEAETLNRVTAADREAYQRDGAYLLRNVLDRKWIERMRKAIGKMVEGPNVSLWMARMDPEFDAFMRHSGMAELAGDMMGADRVNFLYDQMFVKSPKSDFPTPLHQDLPYWPVEGEDIISVWVPFDDVRRENSVVQYVKGSHRWGRMFEPVPFAKGARERDPQVGSAGYEVIDDAQALIDANETLCWELGPGDVIVHHPLTLHFASPNITENENRRAVALRYVGPDCRLIDRPGNFMRRDVSPAYWPKWNYKDGDVLTDPDYPLVWTRP